jgi:hypothetical protein
MDEVVPDVQQEFWRSASVLPLAADPLPPVSPPMADACVGCGREFMIGARFCHSCGLRRPSVGAAKDASLHGSLTATSLLIREAADDLSAAWRKIQFPRWLQYLHFHEIKRCVGLPTASLVAFFIGIGCVIGALGVSLFYKASNLAEFQAIQMWRIEWLLAATAAFVAGILLKPPSKQI